MFETSLLYLFPQSLLEIHFNWLDSHFKDGQSQLFTVTWWSFISLGNLDFSRMLLDEAFISREWELKFADSNWQSILNSCSEKECWGGIQTANLPFTEPMLYHKTTVFIPAKFSMKIEREKSCHYHYQFQCQWYFVHKTLIWLWHTWGQCFQLKFKKKSLFFYGCFFSMKKNSAWIMVVIIMALGPECYFLLVGVWLISK